ncbi:uncharacterized protein LOC113306371 [Papaver somniferum]|uniref:uncharacterized protein LOC113306371 n=1 Tax=Papaver somniferum TaxID=3469 RepID=UPI000E702494|nr:uncharacterized protein LOC113306371 [Papaver somniferum]
MRAKDNLRNLVNQFNPSLIWIAELKIKVSGNYVKNLRLHGVNQMIIHNTCDGSKANIWLFWHSSISTTTVKSTTKQAITVKVGEYKVGVRGTSDHGPIMGNTVGIPKPNNIPFRYQAVWTSHSDFLKVIQSSWEENINGNPAFGFMAKLKRFKEFVKKWNWEIFGDLRVKMTQAEEEVEKVAMISYANPENVELLNHLITTREKQEIVSQQFNELMRAKDRIKWVKEGGANTSFFHTSIKIRKAHNNITELEDETGNLVIYEEDNIFLDAIPSSAEIKKVVFGVDANSAPGPDGFPGSFYRFAWNIVGQDLINALQYCWRCRFIPRGMNSKILFLLPKVQGAKKAEQFRPIGLANFSFKIITRTIILRISSLIEKIVSCQEGAFIKGSNIHEKIVLASEMVNELDIKRRGGNVCLKLEITQAYDSLSWDFLVETIKHFGFYEVGIKWIRILFESAKISVLVNGGPCGFFNVGRRLRQGDPLSSVLFVIAEEVLSRSISKFVHEGKIVPMVNRNSCQPSHLLFADDIFVFCNGKKITGEFNEASNEISKMHQEK